MRAGALLALCTACVLTVVRRKRRSRQSEGDAGCARASGDPQAVDDASDCRDGNAHDGEPEAVQASAATTWYSWLESMVVPSNYLRTWQCLFMLLTLCGSLLNSGATWLDGRPSFATQGILAMGLLHVGAIEAILRATAKKPGLERLQSRTRARPQPVIAGAGAHDDPLSVLPYTPAQISGFWLKDRQRSDNMGPACDIMGLYGLLRHAVNILKGTRILLTRNTFHVAAVSVIPVIKVAEWYALSGEEGRFRRRDQRRGGSYGRVELTPTGVVFHARWDAPYAGSCKETFHLAKPTELHIITEMRVGEQACSYTSVYTRR